MIEDLNGVINKSIWFILPIIPDPQLQLWIEILHDASYLYLTKLLQILWGCIRQLLRPDEMHFVLGINLITGALWEAGHEPALAAWNERGTGFVLRSSFKGSYQV